MRGPVTDALDRRQRSSKFIRILRTVEDEFAVADRFGDTADSLGATATAPVSANGMVTVDVSGLADGTLTVEVDVTDTAGNTASASGTNTSELDTTAPTATVALDDTLISDSDAGNTVTEKDRKLAESIDGIFSKYS